MDFFFAESNPWIAPNITGCICFYVSIAFLFSPLDCATAARDLRNVSEMKRKTGGSATHRMKHRNFEISIRVCRLIDRNVEVLEVGGAIFLGGRAR